MQIKFDNIVLRDMIESDIEDYVRWFTTETEWSNTDAPWEPIESDEETERTSWREYFESVKDLPDDVRRWKFEIEWNGRHIGWVSSYPIDENYEWIGEVKDGQTVYRAIGIDICEPDVWGKGVGTNALRAFINSKQVVAHHCAMVNWRCLPQECWCAILRPSTQRSGMHHA